MQIGLDRHEPDGYLGNVGRLVSDINAVGTWVDWNLSKELFQEDTMIYRKKPWQNSIKSATTTVALALSIFIATNTIVNAAEVSKGIYLLGGKASLAGLVPPPGTYFIVTNYYYSGDASAAAAISHSLPGLGDVTIEAGVTVDAQIFLTVPTILWVAPDKVLGGHVGFGAILPIGWQDISVNVVANTMFTLPNGTVVAAGDTLALNDDTFTLGDPLLTAMLGWNEGNWHWNVAGLLNIPIGAYSVQNIANNGFNRWAFDVTGAVTWLNPMSGIEASAAVGLTFNGENPDTDYKTGTEFHAEGVLMKHVSRDLAFGIGGYYYQQVTGDSGAGAVLGSFKGEVTAIGPSVTYNFKLGQTPVSTSFRWFHEFNAKNRTEGDAIFFTAALPLGAPGHK